MINYLKKLKKSIIKTTKFYKNSNDISFFEILSFFNLRFFYSSPFIRKFFKGKNRFFNKNKKLNDKYFGLEFDQGLVLRDLLDSGISKKYKINENIVEKLIKHFITNEKNIENFDFIKKKFLEKKYYKNLE